MNDQFKICLFYRGLQASLDKWKTMKISEGSPNNNGNENTTLTEI